MMLKVMSVTNMLLIDGQTVVVLIEGCDKLSERNIYMYIP